MKVLEVEGINYDVLVRMTSDGKIIFNVFDRSSDCHPVTRITDGDELARLIIETFPETFPMGEGPERWDL